MSIYINCLLCLKTVALDQVKDDQKILKIICELYNVNIDSSINVLSSPEKCLEYTLDKTCPDCAQLLKESSNLLEVIREFKVKIKRTIEDGIKSSSSFFNKKPNPGRLKSKVTDGNKEIEFAKYILQVIVSHNYHKVVKIENKKLFTSESSDDNDHNKDPCTKIEKEDDLTDFDEDFEQFFENDNDNDTFEDQETNFPIIKEEKDIKINANDTKNSKIENKINCNKNIEKESKRNYKNRKRVKDWEKNLEEFAADDPALKRYKICEPCSKVFNHKENYAAHMWTQHQSKIIKCPEPDCEEEFYAGRLLSYHTNSVHKNLKFICNICQKECPNNGSLNAHIKSVHPDGQIKKIKLKPILKCPYKRCGRIFNGETALKVHISKIHQNPENLVEFECQTCQKIFSSEKHLKNHNFLIHEEKTISCSHNDCDFKTNSERRYKKHVFNMHSINMCHHCGKSFQNFLIFKAHLEGHNENKHKCNICHKEFARNDVYKRHIRNHEESKKYKCSKCFKGFDDPWKMEAHESLHSDLKNVGCNICDKRFTHKYYLSQHMRNSHKIKAGDR